MVAGRSARSGAAGRLALVLAILGTAGLVALSLSVGTMDLTDDPEMFWITRVPRTAALVLSGSAMALCGLVMQLLTQNKFVEPTTAGSTEWAALGLLSTVVVFPAAGVATTMLVAVAFSFGGTLLFLGFLRRVELRSSLVVPIVGLMLGAVVSSLTTYLALSTDRLQLITTWFMGSFTTVERGRYELLYLAAAVCVAAYLAADRFTVAGLGEEVSTNLGVNHRRVLLLGTALVAVATGITTVVVGFLPFLGLVVPNLVSLAGGDHLRRNIPWVCLGGAALILVCDVAGRLVRWPFEIPVSVILGIIGAAVFLALLWRQRGRAG